MIVESMYECRNCGQYFKVLVDDPYIKKLVDIYDRAGWQFPLAKHTCGSAYGEVIGFGDIISIKEVA